MEVAIAVLVALVFAAVFLWCALTTLQFGSHADESRTTDAVIATTTSGLLLPGWYNYPSLIYLVSVVTALFHTIASIEISNLAPFARALATVGADGVAAGQARLVEILGSTQYQNTLRAVFAVLTALTGPVIIWAARNAGTSWLAAVVAGAIVLSSFQVFYHARWIAADGLVMLACAMTLGAALRAARDSGLFWLTAAAIGAGLATAGKYPAGFLLIVPLLLAMRGPDRMARTGRVMAVFVATYLFITPGTIVDPVRFLRHVLYETSHYRDWGHGVHTVEPGWQFLEFALDFLVFRLTSPHGILSAAIFVTALWGAAIVWRRDRFAATLLIGPPLVYMIYFATNRVFFVRNFLVLLPFIAILAAITVDALAKVFRSNAARWTVPLGALCLLTFNWSTILQAKSSFLDTDSESWRRSISIFLSGNPDRQYAASPKVMALFSEIPGSSLPRFNLPDQADAYLYVLREHNDRYIGDALRPITNRRGIYRVVAGPNDVDLDYYPTWDGLERVVLVDSATASLLTGQPFASRRQ